MRKRSTLSDAFAQLVGHIRRGDAEGVREAVSLGADVNGFVEGGERPLSLARHSPELLRLLLAAGADPDVRLLFDARGPTLLMLLAESAADEPRERLRLLLRAGADLEARDVSGETALFYAERAARPDLVEALLAMGANPNVENRGGASVLLLALRALDEGAEGLVPGSVHQQIVDVIRRYGSDEAGRVDLELERAAARGAVEQVRELLSRGAHASFAPDLSVLAVAAERGHAAVVRALLEAGADPTSSVSRETPLALAAKHGHLEVVRLLVEAGAEGRDPEALAGARAHRRADVVAYLEDTGARGHSASSPDGPRPVDQALLSAVLSGDLAAIGRALAEGAALEREHAGRTPLEHAFEARAPDMVVLRLIAAGADVGRVRNQIIWAARSAPAPVLRRFVEAGADIDLPTRAGRPVQLAARRGDLMATRVLIESGADLDAEGRLGNALSDAVLQGHAECAEALLQAGARIEVGYRFQPLIALAADRGHVSLVKALLDSGDDVDRRSILRGRAPASGTGPMARFLQGTAASGVEAVEMATPLLIAARRGHLEVVRLLITRGANLEIVDDSGRTAVQRAREEGHGTIVQALLVAGAELDPPLPPVHALFLALERHELDEVRRLLDLGGDLESRDPRLHHAGKTPLLLAAELGDEAMVALLLSRELAAKASAATSIARVPANREARNAAAITVAARLGHLGVVEQLIDAGASPDARDREENTPLVLAAAQGHARIVERLLGLGAKVDAPGPLGRTALAVAVAAGKIATTRLLLAAGADPNRPCVAGTTPFALALRSQAPEAIVRALLEAGADRSLAERPEVAQLERGAEVSLERRLARPRDSAIDLSLYELDAVRRRLAARMHAADLVDALARIEAVAGSKARALEALGRYEVHVRSSRTLDIAELQRRFLAEKCFVFAGSTRGAARSPDRLVVLATEDKLEAITAMGTSGGSHDLGLDDVLRFMLELDRRAPYRLTEIRADLLAGEFLEPVEDPAALAAELGEFCPEVLGEGGASLETLADELRRRPRFILPFE